MGTSRLASGPKSGCCTIGALVACTTAHGASGMRRGRAVRIGELPTAHTSAPTAAPAALARTHALARTRVPRTAAAARRRTCSDTPASAQRSALLLYGRSHGKSSGIPPRNRSAPGTGPPPPPRLPCARHKTSANPLSRMVPDTAPQGSARAPAPAALLCSRSTTGFSAPMFRHEFNSRAEFSERLHRRLRQRRSTEAQGRTQASEWDSGSSEGGKQAGVQESEPERQHGRRTS